MTRSPRRSIACVGRVFACLAVIVYGCDSSAVYLGTDVKTSDAGTDAGGRHDRDAGRPGPRDAGLLARDAASARSDASIDAAAIADASAMKPEPDSDAATCTPGFADCNGEPSDGCEVDLTSDAKHCGSCEKACTTRGFDTFGGRCVDSRCSLTCEQGMADCDGNPDTGCEVFLRLDAKNCGACGVVCTGSCNQGSCAN